MRKVLACGSGLIKTDSNGRKYRWHAGRYDCGGEYHIDPSRYYEDTGMMFYETKDGLKLVKDDDENI